MICDSLCSATASPGAQVGVAHPEEDHQRSEGKSHAAIQMNVQSTSSSSSGKAKPGFKMRVKMSGNLAADDLWDYFEQFGEVIDGDFLCERKMSRPEIAIITWTNSSSTRPAMRVRKHQVVRSYDQKRIAVDASVQFSDNDHLHRVQRQCQ